MIVKWPSFQITISKFQFIPKNKEWINFLLVTLFRCCGCSYFCDSIMSLVVIFDFGWVLHLPFLNTGNNNTNYICEWAPLWLIMKVETVSQQEKGQANEVNNRTSAKSPFPTYITLNVDNGRAAYHNGNIESEEKPV